jgi:hypothetical protein
MHSHHYQITTQDTVGLLFGPLVTIIILAIGLHAAPRTGLLPPPRPGADMDQVILTHQIDASRAGGEIQLILAGDSSCLMNIDARELSRRLGLNALNLGTLSFLDLRAHTELIRQALYHNPQSLHTVVLLMHPEALRKSAPESYQTEIFHHYLAGKDLPAHGSGYQQLRSWLGLHILQGRVADRLFPRPLGGDYGRAYGFLSGVDRHMTEHAGSLLDPTRQPARGNPEYFLDPWLEMASRELRQFIPSTVRCVVGITPLPESFAGPDYPPQHLALLDQWADWLGADPRLNEMPAVLPDTWFATKTHLTREGVEHYTATLADILLHLP